LLLIPSPGLLFYIQGTAVWCLASDETDSVQYHIDYMELHRYETNTIYPPLYAGTCHVSPLNGETDIKGGGFQANIRGVDHYRQFGYKGKLASEEEMQEDLKSSDWMRVQYKHNRGILHDGDYPHLSTPVTYIKPGYKRVILGFNSFPDILAECCMRAPEHSDAFNRTIKLYQTLAALGMPITTAIDNRGGEGEEDDKDNLPPSPTTGSGSSSSSITPISTSDIAGCDRTAAAPIQKKSGGAVNIKDIMKNPALAKLLVIAARKVKQKEAEEEEQRRQLETSLTTS